MPANEVSARHAVAAADVRRDYEPLAATFEERWRRFHAATRNWVLANWPEALPEGARILDIGCGVGGFLAALAERQPGLSLYGADIVPAMIGRARRLAPTAALAVADAQHPPFAPSSFDAIVSLNILHHLEDPNAHLAALASLCRPGGTIIVSTFAGGRTWRMRFADWWLKGRNPAWHGMLSSGALQALIAGQPGLIPVAAVEIKADRWWWLQLHRLDKRPDAG